MSAQNSRTNLDLQERDVEHVLEKLESQTAPGEFTPLPANSPANSIIEKLDEEKLEEGKGTTTEPGPITHRPTGFKVRIRDFFILVFFNLCLVGTHYVFIPHWIVSIFFGQYDCS